MSTTATKKYHSVQETMERLSMGKTTVYQLAKSGLLKIVRLPSAKKERRGVKQRHGITRITTESIERYERGEARPTTAQPQKLAATPRQVRTRTPGKTIELRHFRPR
jgi:hypothetical protein